MPPAPIIIRVASTLPCMRLFWARSSRRRSRSTVAFSSASRAAASSASALAAPFLSRLISRAVAATCNTWIPATAKAPEPTRCAATTTSPAGTAQAARQARLVTTIVMVTSPPTQLALSPRSVPATRSFWKTHSAEVIEHLRDDDLRQQAAGPARPEEEDAPAQQPGHDRDQQPRVSTGGASAQQGRGGRDDPATPLITATQRAVTRSSAAVAGIRPPASSRTPSAIRRPTQQGQDHDRAL